MKKERIIKHLFTLVFSVLLLINSIPMNVFADEFEEGISEEVISETVQEEVPEQTEETVEVKEETVEVKEEQPQVTEEKTEENAVVTEEVQEEVPVEAFEEVPAEAIEEAVQISEKAEDAEALKLEVSNSVMSEEKKESIKVTVTFEMLSTSAQPISTSTSNTLSKGSGWNISQTKANNAIANYKKASSNGYIYEWTGEWVDQNGSPVSFPLSFRYADLEDDVDLHIIAVYEVTKVKQLHLNYTDKVSTGSGSWSNVDSFVSHTHTFKQPAGQSHYQFLYWEDVNTGARYVKGDRLTHYYKDLVNEEEYVEIHAIWQPSLTIRYHSHTGSTLKNVEVYEDYDLYSYRAQNLDGMSFLGWSYDSENLIGEGTTLNKPSATYEKVEQNIVDVYALYSTSYNAEHYLQDLDGNYSFKEGEKIENVIYGSTVNAEQKEYEGFSFNGEISESSAAAKPGLVLKLYYDRNSHSVSYVYENAPENAPELPEAKSYRYEEEVVIAEVPAMEGYTFSGWDSENFEMPDHDVVIKGSWTAHSHKVRYEYSGETPQNAPELPEEKEYGFNEEVIIAEEPTLEGYTFSGWDKEDFSMPDEDVVISGSFEINRYTVTWVNEDGSLLELDEAVEYGSMPEYNARAPKKKADGRYTYTFIGWTPEIEAVKGDVTYTAVYKAVAIPADKDDDTPAPEEPVVPQRPVTPTEEIPEEVEPVEEIVEISEEPAPLTKPEEVIIPEAEVPQAPVRSWALLNLLATIAAILTALGMIITFFTKKKEEEEEDDHKEEMIYKEEEEEKEGRKKSKFLGLIPAIISIIVFILKEDMRNPMVWIDRYTILMIIIMIVNLLLAFVTRNRKKDEEEEEEQEENLETLIA